MMNAELTDNDAARQADAKWRKSAHYRRFFGRKCDALRGYEE